MKTAPKEGEPGNLGRLLGLENQVGKQTQDDGPTGNVSLTKLLVQPHSSGSVKFEERVNNSEVLRSRKIGLDHQ